MSKPKMVLDKAAVYFKKLIVMIAAGLMFLLKGVWVIEGKLKVAFVYKPIKFIGWSAETINHLLKLCVFGVNKEMHEAMNQFNGNTWTKQVVERLDYKPAKSSQVGRK